MRWERTIQKVEASKKAQDQKFPQKTFLQRESYAQTVANGEAAQELLEDARKKLKKLTRLKAELTEEREMQVEPAVPEDPRITILRAKVARCKKEIENDMASKEEREQAPRPWTYMQEERFRRILCNFQTSVRAHAHLEAKLTKLKAELEKPKEEPQERSAKRSRDEDELSPRPTRPCLPRVAVPMMSARGEGTDPMKLFR